jgi:hypothetical protein
MSLEDMGRFLGQFWTPQQPPIAPGLQWGLTNSIGIMGGLPCTIEPTETDRIVNRLEKHFVSGPILAWRGWKLDSEKGTLHSLTTSACWPFGVPMYGDSTVGHLGVYAMKAREGVVISPSRQNPMISVIGQVALWGQVIEHEFGYRGEYGYPYSIVVSRPMPNFPVPHRLQMLLEIVHAGYGCHVMIA